MLAFIHAVLSEVSPPEIMTAGALFNALFWVRMEHRLTKLETVLKLKEDKEE